MASENLRDVMKKLCLGFCLICLVLANNFAQTKPKIAPKKSVTKKITDAVTNVFKDKNELSKFEKDVYDEINLVRTNPKEYVKYLEDFLKTFDGEIFTSANNVKIITKEGKKPVEEVIAILKKMKPLAKFILSEGLNNAATDHTQDLSKHNKTGHRGTDGSFPQDRIRRYGIVGANNENISYFAKTPRDIVFNMLIDDGVLNRGHRKNVLSSSLKFIGISSTEHKEVEIVCVVIFATDFIEKKK